MRAALQLYCQDRLVRRCVPHPTALLEGSRLKRTAGQSIERSTRNFLEVAGRTLFERTQKLSKGISVRTSFEVDDSE